MLAPALIPFYEDPDLITLRLNGSSKAGMLHERKKVYRRHFDICCANVSKARRLPPLSRLPDNVEVPVVPVALLHRWLENLEWHVVRTAIPLCSGATGRTSVSREFVGNKGALKVLSDPRAALFLLAQILSFPRQALQHRSAANL
jgi:hypothetical protein